MIPTALQKKEYLLLSFGILFAAAAPFRPNGLADETSLELVSALWLLVACVFIVFGKQFRGIAVPLLAVVLFSYLIMSFTTNIWADQAVPMTNVPDMPRARETSNVGSTYWFLFDCAIVLPTMAVAAMLVFGQSNRDAAKSDGLSKT